MPSAAFQRAMPSLGAVPPKISPEQEVSNRLTAAYEAATPEDKFAIQALVREAVGAAPSVRTVLITPGMGAILFHDHNTQNREWQYRLTLEYNRQMLNRDWDFTPNGIGFSPNGQMLDGQHRMSAEALNDQPLLFSVALGVDLRAVEVIDTGKRRPPSTAVYILQHRDMPESRSKTDVLIKADTYLSKAVPRARQLLDSRAIGRELTTQDQVLTEAMNIALRATHGIAKPTLKPREAQVLAYVLLSSAWPAQVVEAHLNHFQTGQDVGENSPFFVGAKILESEPRGEKFSLMEKLSLTVRVFKFAETGVKAVQRRSLRDLMSKPEDPNLPTGVVTP